MTELQKPRANYSMEFKLAMVEKSLQPGVSVALLARNNGINDNLLFKWRRRYRHLVDAPVDEGAGIPVIIEGKIVPVVFERTPALLPAVSPAPATQPKLGQVFEFAIGRARLKLSGNLTTNHAGDACSRTEEGALMIPLPAGSRIWLVAGVTDMRNGFNGQASLVQSVLNDDQFSGHLFIFRGRHGDMIKLLWADEDGLCLFVKRLERGRFVWPAIGAGKIHLTPAQPAMLLEGLNWKHQQRAHQLGLRV